MSKKTARAAIMETKAMQLAHYVSTQQQKLAKKKKGKQSVEPTSINWLINKL